MSINPIKFTLCFIFPFLSNVLGKMHYGPNLLFCSLTLDGHSPWTLSGFNYCLACFYTLIEHRQGSKFVSHFVADFNVMS